MITYNIDSLLSRLEETGLLKNKPQAAAQLLVTMNHYKPPVYIDLFIGIGLCVSAVLIASLIKSLHLINTANIGYWSLGCIIASLTLYYAFKHNRTLLRNITFQVCVLLMWGAKVLFIFFAYYILSDFVKIGFFTKVALALGVITLPCYFIFPIQIDRIVSITAFLITLLCAIFIKWPLWGLLGFSISLSVMMGFIYLIERESKYWDPLSQACGYALGITSIALIVSPQLAYHTWFLPILGIFIIVGLTLISYFKRDFMITCYAAILSCFGLAYFFYMLDTTTKQKTIILLLLGLTLIVLSNYLVKFKRRDNLDA